MKPANSGCGRVGRDLSSGWNWQPMNQGWSGSSIISTSEPSTTPGSSAASSTPSSSRGPRGRTRCSPGSSARLASTATWAPGPKPGAGPSSPAGTSEAMTPQFGSAPFLIAGPCVVESDDLNLRVGEGLADLAAKLGLHVIYKASYDKANRSRLRAARGPR